MTQPRCLPPETPSVISLRGPDAARFLNGQITQDVSNMDSKSLPACVTDAKGRLQHFTHVCRGPEENELWLVAPSDQAESLFQRLDRYLIADDVAMDDLTGQWEFIHAEACEADTGADAVFTRERQGVFGMGRDLWMKKGSHPALNPISPDEREHLRICMGLPAWDKELVEGMLPPEAGLDATAISYHKGCYIGQEVISRIKSVGRVNRRLALFSLNGKSQADETLLSGDNEAGTLTSVSPMTDDSGSFPAMGYVKRKLFDEEVLKLGSGVKAQRVRWA